MEASEIRRIAAFLPCEQAGVGPGVEVYFRDGNAGWINLSLRSFVNRLAGTFSINVQEARKRFGPLTGQRNLIPLVLAPLLLYVPLKTRTPGIDGDPAYGYFRLRSILQLHEHTIFLEGGHRVAVKQSIRTIHRRLRAARTLESHMMELFSQAMDAGIHPCFPAWPQVFPTWQENTGTYGILAEEKEKGELEMELRNLMENLVMQRIDEITASTKEAFCRCEQCRLDIAALALNELPPRYVVTQRGETYSKADILEIQRYVDVVAAVAKAMSLVQKNPRHQ